MPALLSSSSSQAHKEAKEMDREERMKRKVTFDKKHRANEQEIKEGDKVMIKQEKTTVKPPFDPKPFTVTKVRGSQVTAERGSKVRVRNKAKVKLIKNRPEHLQKGSKGKLEDDASSDDDDDYINLTSVEEPEEVRPAALEPLQDRPQGPEGEELQDLLDLLEEEGDQEEQNQEQQEDHHPEAPDPAAVPLSPVRPRSRRLRKRTARFAEEQNSPQERKKLQSKAKHKRKEKANS